MCNNLNNGVGIQLKFITFLINYSNYLKHFLGAPPPNFLPFPLLQYPYFLLVTLAATPHPVGKTSVPNSVELTRTLGFYNRILGELSKSSGKFGDMLIEVLSGTGHPHPIVGVDLSSRLSD